MKKLLHKRVGGKRHREWAWAAVLIALCVLGITMWATSRDDARIVVPVDTSYIPVLNQITTNAPAARDTSVIGVIASLWLPEPTRQELPD